MTTTSMLSLAAFALLSGTGSLMAQTVNPSSLPKITTIDDRFQSFNIEMVEVTGGRFWKPYADVAKAAGKTDAGASHPVGMDPSLYEYRLPIDLSNAKLGKLAAALAPSYLRVSGTWANTSYFQDSDDPRPARPPTGFVGVLTRPEWKGVVDFSKVVDAGIITSFATSAGTRNADGVWTPDQASQFLAYTQSIGGNIAAAEFMNEPTFAEMGGAPKGYSAAAYAHDLAVFIPWAKKAAPRMLILGPGSVGEGMSLGLPASMRLLKSEDLLSASDPKALDVFSYHFYSGVSKRCTAGSVAPAIPDSALSEEFLSRTSVAEAFYAGLRDRFAPGKPLWLTETAEAACGGDVWAASFIDSFRYLDQLGRMAQRGVQVVAHNTLAASDYGLLDEKTLMPRPNYWSALLWRKFMGTTVLKPVAPEATSLHVYAHCLRGEPGGVSMLVINTDRTSEAQLKLEGSSQRYTLTSQDLLSSHVALNGSELKLGDDDALPDIAGTQTKSGAAMFAPGSITFLIFAQAMNKSCQ